MRVAVVITTLAVGLSGCGIDKADEHGRQLDVIGDVEISTTFCTSSDTERDSRACAAYTLPHRGELLVAYRVPDGSALPEELTDDGGVRHFTRSESYTTYMRESYPEDGMHWVGYVSDPHSTNAGDQYAFTVSPEVTLPAPGAPFAGPLRYQVVGGYRAVNGDDPGPVDCDDTDTTDCTSTGVAAEDSSQPTRDLAVLPGGDPPVVEAGGRVAVPFDLRFAGSGGENVAFSLSASEGALSQQTLSPAADSDNSLTVDVAVPAGTAPGDYEVSLTATAVGEGDVVIQKSRPGRLRVGGTQRRIGTMIYRVVAPAPASDPPAVDPPPAPHAEPPPVPLPVHAPHTARARLSLSLTALPRRAYAGTNVSYRVAARNVSREPALRARVCARLPPVVQLARATAGVTFAGSELCFDRPRLAAGAQVAARLVAHVDVDAHAGPTLARATASASNAALVRARARMRVLRRPCHTERAPVTG
jgi:hypothetical protein